MNKERVAELAEQYRDKCFEMRISMMETIKQAIETAVAEQIECDAKIADRLSDGNKAGGELSAGQIIASTTIAQAIRSQP